MGIFKISVKKVTRQSKYSMMDRDGLKSTISLGHGQEEGMGGSLVLGEAGEPPGERLLAAWGGGPWGWGHS
jgi:hypothetical protein